MQSKAQKINIPEDLAKVINGIIEIEDKIDQDKEHFFVIGVDNRNAIQYIDLVSLGTIDAAFAEPRETFRLAVMKGVKSILICHNHISNECEPSEDDLSITLRLIKAGKILGIELLDHVILCKNKNKLFSFAREGLINEKNMINKINEKAVKEIKNFLKQKF